MNYRPYPSAERALRQVARHAPTPELSPLQQQLAKQARAGLAAAAVAVQPLAQLVRTR